jgi:molecular chaperone DnaK (HSP70)
VYTDRVFGIDFGTTRTVVACADRGNHPVVDFVDDAGDARGWIPSMVAERDGELRFGFDAVAVADDPSFNVARSFKRLISGAERAAHESVRLGRTELTVGELVTRFLVYVHDALRARSTLRRKIPAGHPLRAVVGVPANAFAAQRLMTIDAFRAAGFEVGAVINEPSAAGFEYTHRHRGTLTSKRDVVVVYDMGGGTFDSSVVRMSGRHHEVLSTAGVNRLGGDDFDEVMGAVAMQAAGLRDTDLTGRVRERWIEQCRAAKEALNPNSRKVTLDLEAVLGQAAPKPEVSFPVTDYYDACAPLIERSIEAMTPLMSRAENESVPDLDDIAGIYVVGGATELPIIGRALRERFGRRVHRSPYPAAAVAIGLSIAADDEGTFELVDRYTRTFAVFREGDAGREIVLDPIFTRDAVLPDGHEALVFTRSYRAAHNIGHFRFFECSAVDERGKPRGDMAVCPDVLFPFDPQLADRTDLSGIPVARRFDEGPRIVERYALDRDGIVRVVIQNADAGYERTYQIGG